MPAMGPLVMLIFCAGLQATANLLFRGGVKQGGGLPDQIPALLHALLRLLLEPLFVVGLIAYVMAAAVWMKILSAAPITYSYPLLVGFTFIFVTLGGVYFFRESLGLVKILGLVIIVVGIMVVSKG